MEPFLTMLLIKSAVLSAVALIVVGGLQRFAAQRVSASARHTAGVAAFAMLAVLPALSAVLPAWRVSLPPLLPAPLSPRNGEKWGVLATGAGRLSGMPAVSLPHAEHLPAKPNDTGTRTPSFSTERGERGRGERGTPTQPSPCYSSCALPSDTPLFGAWCAALNPYTASLFPVCRCANRAKLPCRARSGRGDGRRLCYLSGSRRP